MTLLWFGSQYILSNCFGELTQRGLFGDSFGAINALFSGLAFAGVIYAVIMQKEELEMQRTEM